MVLPHFRRQWNAQGCPSHEGHVKEKVTQGTPISLYHSPYRPVNYAVCWPDTGPCFLLCLHLPSHQATAGNRAPQRKGEHCHLRNTVAGKVPSLGNQFSAQSTRFTTPFMSTYSNIDLICPRYQAFLKQRPAFDLTVTYFLKSVYCWKLSVPESFSISASFLEDLLTKDDNFHLYSV